MHPEVPGAVVKQEIFNLADSWIVAMEIDCENIQNDALNNVEQSLFVVDDKQKIYQLRGEGGVKLVVTKTIEIPGKCLDMSKLQNTEWMHVHVT